MIYTYEIYRLGWTQCPMLSDVVTAENPEMAMRVVEDMTWRTVVRHRIGVQVVILDGDRQVASGQYEREEDFVRARRAQKKLSACYVENSEQTLHWYLAVGEKTIQQDTDHREVLPFHPLILTKLFVERVPLGWSSRLIGPFESEDAARTYQEKFGLMPIPHRRHVSEQRGSEKGYRGSHRKRVNVRSKGVGVWSIVPNLGA